MAAHRKESALSVAKTSSAHCAGIGPDKLLFECFFKPAVARLGLGFQCSLQVSFSLDAA